MIKIDKHNVEAYFLDHLEGNLSAEDTALLLAFIDANPEFSELFEDTDDLLSLQLKPTNEKFGDIDDLKTLPCSDDEICLANIDYWLIAKTENTLSAEDVKTLDAFVAANNLENTESYIRAAYLKPNLSETFGDLSVLKKEGGTIIPLLIRFASVAAVFVFIWLAWNPNKSVESTYVSRTEDSNALNEMEYISPELNPVESVIPVNTSNPILKSQSTKTIASNNGGITKIKSNPAEEFKLLDQSFESIDIPNNFVFNNPPQLLNEDFNISSVFSDFEETIANNQINPNDDYAQVNYNKPKYELQEQYRPVTRTLSNLTSLNMSVKKMPEASDISQTVVQVGKFSFERKKKK